MTHDPVKLLAEEESLRRLRSVTVGRVVTRVGDVIDIFPVNFMVDSGDVVLRTAEGAKLAEMVIGPEVLFEADSHDDREVWSVIIRGSARVLSTEAEIAAAEALPLVPLIPTLKRNFVRITPTSISGRAFEVGEEPARDGVQNYPS